MTLALTARIRLNPRSILEHPEAHELAHLLARARRGASVPRPGAMRRLKVRRAGAS